MASTVKEPEMVVLIGVRCLAWFAVLVFANLPALAFAQVSCPGMHVKIARFSNRQMDFLPFVNPNLSNFYPLSTTGA